MKQPKPRRRTGRKLVLGVLVVGVAGAFGVQALLPAQTVRTHLIDAVERQTGRTLSVGDLSLRIVPWPMFVAHDVSLSGAGQNPAPVVTAHEIRARIAFLPLFARRIVLDDVAVLQPHLVLARGDDGVANWHFVPAPRPASGADSTSGSSSVHWDVALRGIRIDGAEVQWDDAPHHARGQVTLDHAAFSALDGTTPGFDIHGHHGKGGFTLHGTVGDLHSVLWPSGAVSAWPFHHVATVAPGGVAGDDMVRADGTLDAIAAGGSLRLSGYRLSTSGKFGNLRDVDALFPHADVPDVVRVGFDAAVADTGQGARFDHLHLTTGAARLSNQINVASSEIGAARRDDPLGVRVEGTFYGQTLRVHGTFATLAGVESAWHAGVGGALATPLSLALDAEGPDNAAMHAQGVVGGDDTALDLSGHLPHLALTPGWALDDVVTSTHLGGQPGHAVTLSDLKLTSRQIELGGGGSVSQGGVRPVVSAQLAVARADLDAMKVAAPASATAAPATPAPSGSPMLAGAPPASAPAAEAPEMGWLHRADFAVDLSVAQATANGAAYSGLVAHARTQGGDIPSGTLDLAPAVVPAPVLAHWFGIAPWVDGSVQLVGHLAGQGTDRAAIMQSLSGHLGASMVGGTLDAARLRPVLGGPAGMLMGHGDLSVRCLGLHMALADGQARFDTMGLEAGRLSLSGQGTIGLNDGALDLHLVPRIGIVGGAGASTPVAVTGTLDAPQARMEASAQDGRFNVTIGGADGDADRCPAILASARENLPGPVPAAPPAHHGGHHLSDMLRGLGLVH